MMALEGYQEPNRNGIRLDWPSAKMSYPRRLLHTLLIVFITVGSMTISQASFANNQADEMLNLLQKRPRRMSRERWLELRREAARELGRIKDQRAVPILLDIIERERFDVILEIAIDALGEIGDKRAIAPLKRLLNDPSLDSYVRDAVAGALRKLRGESTRTTQRTKIYHPTYKTSKTQTENATDSGNEPAKETQPDMATRLAKEQTSFPELVPIEIDIPPELIARSDRWEIAAGTANIRWDGASERTSGFFSARTAYHKQVERKGYGYTLDGAADFGFRLSNSPARDASWGISHGVALQPEIRFYPFKNDVPKLFGQISSGLGYGLGIGVHPYSWENRFSFAGVISVAAGPGFGRVYDVGQWIRLRRFERVLKKAKLLNATIDKSIGDQLVYAWYKLRNRLGTYEHLGHAIDILRRSGLLAKDQIPPDVTYRLIRILDDPQLENRLAGIMLRLGYGYGRSLVKDADDTTMAFLYATAEYQHQKTLRSLEARLKFVYEMYNDPDFFALNLEGGYSTYLYNSNFDPLGALSATISAGLSNNYLGGYEGAGLGLQILAGGAYSRFFNRGTKVTAAIKGGLDNYAPLFLFTLEAQFGIASGSFTTVD